MLFEMEVFSYLYDADRFLAQPNRRNRSLGGDSYETEPR